MDAHHTVKLLQRYKTLMWILLLNVVASVLHYVHNVMYFQHYPEPDWLSAHIVDYVWFLMTFIGLAGLAALISNKRNTALALLYLYAAINMLSTLHYAVDSSDVMTIAMHSFIWLEALCAAGLIYYLAVCKSLGGSLT